VLDGAIDEAMRGCTAPLCSSITCGSFDPSTVVQCDSYANLTCDISGYFDGLTQNFKCTNDIPDPSGLTAWIDKAKCQ